MTIRPNAAWLFLLAALCLAACGKSDDDLMTEAEQLAAHQQWSDAMSRYHAVVQSHPAGPRSAEAMYRMGMIQYDQLKDAASGARRFREVVDRFPQSVESLKSLMVLGFIYAEEPAVRNRDSAVYFFQQVLDRYPTHELARGARIQLDRLAREENVEPPPDATLKPRMRGDSLITSPTARELAH